MSRLLDWLRDRLRPRPPGPPPVPPPPPPGDPAADLLAAHNRERQGRGLPPLRLDARLNLAAQRHAEWMARAGRLDHAGPGGTTFAERAEAAGYPMGFGGENVAAGQVTVAEVMFGWMSSAGHRANVLSPRYVDAGFGRAGTYWCAVFGRPRQ